MKIIHITEALASGVAYCISQLAQAQAAEGHQVVIAHSLRSDTPVESLPELFPGPIKRIVLPMVTPIVPVTDMRATLQIYALLKAERPDVLHLHSSKAGALGRVAATLLGIQKRTLYSPHGFAFLREDISSAKQKAFLYFERFASRLGGTLVVCSETEGNLAREVICHPRTVLVENAIDLSEVLKAAGSTNGRVRVVTSSRICYQKAPWRFRELAQGCVDLPADFVWLGDGDLRQELLVNGQLPENIQISGWRTRSAVYSALASADVFVLPSLWEGMPLALIEAQASGLPAVVSDVVGNRDVVVDGETGFVCGSDSEMLQKIRILIQDPALRNRMGAAASRLAAARLGIDRMHREMMAVYNCSRDC